MKFDQIGNGQGIITDNQRRIMVKIEKLESDMRYVKAVLANLENWTLRHP